MMQQTRKIILDDTVDDTADDPVIDTTNDTSDATTADRVDNPLDHKSHS